MTTIYVTDANTGELVEINVESPTGNLYVEDYEGTRFQLDLSAPSGLFKVLDADTGETLTIDYSDPTATFTVIDPNTGEFVDVNLSSLTGILYSIDENTGDFVQVDLSTAKFINTGSPISIGGGVTLYTISGTVYDADGSTAVEGATVTLGELSTTSAANGTYTIGSVPAGTSGSMTCTKTGYSWTAITVSAMGDNLTSQDYSNAWWAAGGCGAICVRAYQPVGAASLAASYSNLVNPGTNNAAPGVAPTWDAVNGWTFNGTSQYLTTGSIPTVNSSIILRFTTNGTLASQCGDGSNFFGWEGDTLKVYHEKGGFELSGLIGSSGTLAIAAQKGYINAVEDKTIGAGTGIPNREIFIGARNQSGTPGGFAAWKCQAWAMYSADITSYLTALNAAMAALP